MENLKPIYLDYQATTPLDPRVLQAMMPYLTTHFGNAASSAHGFGTQAARAVEQARNHIAANLGGSPLGLIFTSGATESINLALKGLAAHHGCSQRDHIITYQTEHPAVIDCCQWLETQGFRVTYLGVKPDGHLDMNELDDAMDHRTLALSVMFANNETGVIHDVAAMGALAKERGVFFHCDAVQAVGKEPLDVEALGIDLLSFSAHKIYGPKGMGALWARRKQPRVRLGLQIHGGGHERGFRSGTLNVAGIVGLDKALELCLTEQAEEKARLLDLRSQFLGALETRNIAFEINGCLQRRLAGNLNLRFPGLSSAQIMNAAPHLAMARGSACTSAAPTPSRILMAMGLSGAAAAQSMRIGFGRMTHSAEIAQAAETLADAVESVQATVAAEPS